MLEDVAVVDIDGAVGAPGGFGDALTAADGVCGAGGCTAAAAAAAYFTGRGAAAVRPDTGRPALSILDIGCCAKFGFGGCFGAVE